HRVPRRWDVVVFRDAFGRPTLKRAVGLPGETVEIRNGDVFIDGKITRRSLAEIYASSTRLDSAAAKRDDDRTTLQFATPVWDADARATRSIPTPISNESPVPRWNGENAAPAEFVRDFILQFDWIGGDAQTPRFTVLARRPEQFLCLQFDAASGATFRSIPATLDGATGNGKTFERLSENDFRRAKSVFIPTPAAISDDAKVTFRVFLVDGELILARNDRELARFSTGDAESTAARGISEPFIILGDAARIGFPTLRRDAHYSAAANSPRVATVPEGQYYLLGDNSPASIDSRFPDFGFIAGDAILYGAASRTDALGGF
ncbi:MAG: hypothetical protein HUK22_00855, partial [Thermoguttaceae bacterium]|nr:hypothetical protein [Thermoguttaceae bacterium]